MVENLPHNWEYQEAGNTVTCGGCGLRFGAEHPNMDDTWSCPVCGDGEDQAAASDRQKKSAADDMLAALKQAIWRADEEAKGYGGLRTDECQADYDMCVAAVKKAEGAA